MRKRVGSLMRKRMSTSWKKMKSKEAEQRLESKIEGKTKVGTYSSITRLDVLD